MKNEKANGIIYYEEPVPTEFEQSIARSLDKQTDIAVGNKLKSEIPSNESTVILNIQDRQNTISATKENGAWTFDFESIENEINRFKIVEQGPECYKVLLIGVLGKTKNGETDFTSWRRFNPATDADDAAILIGTISNCDPSKFSLTIG